MAQDYSNSMYVVGDKRTGVLFIRLTPLRVSILSRAEIANIPGKGSFDEKFGLIAEQIQSFIIQNGTSDEPEKDDSVYRAVGALIERGTTISDADFCFIADLPVAAWTSERIPWPDVEDSLDYLARKDPSNSGVTYPAKTNTSEAAMVRREKSKKKRTK